MATVRELSPRDVAQLLGRSRMKDFVLLPRGQRRCTRRRSAEGRGLPGRLSTSQSTRHLPVSTSRDPLRGPKTLVGRPIRATIRILESLLGFRRLRLPGLRTVRIRLRPRLLSRVPLDVVSERLELAKGFGATPIDARRSDPRAPSTPRHPRLVGRYRRSGTASA